MAEELNPHKVSFEEFQLFYESTEKVVDRRLEMNRWNYSICTATLAAIGVVVGWGLQNQDLFLVAVAAVFVLSSTAGFHCSFWIAQIKSYKELNNAKFKVLNEMAPRIVFSENGEDERLSYRPFEREWKILQDRDAVKQVGKLEALKSTFNEFLVPRILLGVFWGLALLGLVSAVLAQVL